VPLLILDDNGIRRGGKLCGRVVVGRWPSSQVVVNDEAVSRIHAWIDRDASGVYFVADAGSRTGTFLNGRRISNREPLVHGDVLRIGKVEARLLAEDGQPPLGIEEIDLGPRPLPPPTPQTGFLLDCACGAPIWAPWELAGHTGNCRWCGGSITVPLPISIAPVAPVVSEADTAVGELDIESELAPQPESAPQPQSAPQLEPQPAEPETGEAICGVCHGPITPFEEATRCPECDTHFHMECWTENRGCSAYGCGQVNALAKQSESTPTVDEPTEPLVAEPIAAPSREMPWDFLLLAASVVGALAGTLSFGLPALAAGGAAVWRLSSGRGQHRGVLVLSACFAILGALAGIGISYFWYMGGYRWPTAR
jgi:hypothetical protein